VRARRALTGAAAATAGTVLGLFGTRSTVRIGPLTVHAGIRLARAGGTRIDLGLLGTAEVPTHRGPLRAQVQVGALDQDEAARLLDPKTLKQTQRQLPDELRAALRKSGLQAGAAAVAAAGALGALGARPRTSRRATSAATAAATSATLLALGAARAVATVDRDAWQHARLDGLLVHAPKLLGDLRTAPQRLEQYRRQLAELLATATDVQRRVADLPERPDDDTIRLVHVSDIHLSPLALPLARQLVQHYRAAAVLDTGDLVDWGTPAEQSFANQIASLDVPYVYVKGNHDSTGIAAAVARQPNATVLDGDTAQIAGLTLAGMADPRFTPNKTTGDDHGMPKVAQAAARFAEQLAGQQVDIALVHSPAAGRALAGRVPLVLAGDIHRREVRRLDGTTVLVQGSSGGAGLRGVQQEPPVPLQLSVLYLDRATRRLEMVDDVQLAGLGGTAVSIVRRRADELVEAG
jgi:predicted MPP superfamily phosphohydrolase